MEIHPLPVSQAFWGWLVLEGWQDEENAHVYIGLWSCSFDSCCFFTFLRTQYTYTPSSRADAQDFQLWSVRAWGIVLNTHIWKKNTKCLVCSLPRCCARGEDCFFNSTDSAVYRKSIPALAQIVGKMFSLPLSESCLHRAANCGFRMKAGVSRWKWLCNSRSSSRH